MLQPEYAHYRYSITWLCLAVFSTGHSCSISGTSPIKVICSWCRVSWYSVLRADQWLQSMGIHIGLKRFETRGQVGEPWPQSQNLRHVLHSMRPSHGKLPQSPLSASLVACASSNRFRKRVQDQGGYQQCGRPQLRALAECSPRLKWFPCGHEVDDRKEVRPSARA